MSFGKCIHLIITASSPQKVLSCSFVSNPPPLPQPQANTDLLSDAIVLLKFNFN